MEKFRKIHFSGHKNLYAVTVKYTNTNAIPKSITMRYGNFNIAKVRYDIECSNEKHPLGFNLEEVSLVLESYSNLDKIEEELLMKVKFGIKKGNLNFKSCVGEVMYE